MRRIPYVVAALLAIGSAQAVFAPEAAVDAEEATEAVELFPPAAPERPLAILDPIDGSLNYLDLSPDYAVMAAWLERGVYRAAVVHFPAWAETYWGIEGAGVWHRRSGTPERRVILPAPRPAALIVNSSLPRETSGALGRLGLESVTTRCSAVDSTAPLTGRARGSWVHGQPGRRRSIGFFLTHLAGGIVHIGGVRWEAQDPYTLPPGPSFTAADEEMAATLQRLAGELRMSDDEATPLAPTLTAHLFPRLGAELVALLRLLEPPLWRAPTVCPGWEVRDVAAHLLDSALRRLAIGRDGHSLPPPERPIAGYRDLVALLDRWNAEWVTAARRLSPELLTGLLEWVEPQLAAHLAELDPFGEAAFGVAWAGEERSPVWFDVARELTERWHHQAQIRLATGAPPLVARELSEPVFDTFLRAVPHHYAAVGGDEAAAVGIAIHGAATYSYTLRMERGAWSLLKRRAGSVHGAGGGASEGATTASIEIAEQPAWLLLTKGMTAERARAEARVEGEERLAAPFFGTLAVMA